MSLSCFFFFTLGFLTLPALAYAQRSSWRMLYLWTSIPAFCYTIIIHFFVQESPRWLAMQKQTDEAKRISEVFSSMKKLVTTRSTLLKLVVAMITGSGIGMVYYGMPLLVSSLTPNLYLSIVYNALAEMPTSLATFFLMSYIRRRISLISLTMICGIASLLCVFRGISSNLQLASEVISFLVAGMALNVILVYSVELFPTCIRSSALSLVKQAVTLGGALAPILMAEGRRRTRFWSFGVFSIVVICCGLFVVFLPETKGKDLTDDFEDEIQTESSTGTP